MNGRQAKAQRAERARAAAALAARLESETFWHGGAPGLQVGAFLLTAAAAAAGQFETAHSSQLGYVWGTTDRQRVYFSSDREVARGYSGLYQVTGVPTGALYRVEPIGPIEEDPDFAGRDVSWCAPGARIIAVEEERVALDEYGAMERIGPYMAWTNGDPIYDARGHFLPNPKMGAHGITTSWLAERYKPWTPYATVDATLNQFLAADRR